MTMRRCLYALLCLAAFGTLAARAEGYPERPIRLIAPIAPGGLTDSLARVIADRMGQRLGQNVFVDNRPGAGGILGMTAGASAPADGYNLVFVYQGVASVNPVLYKKAPYETLASFDAVGEVGTFPLALAVDPKLPAKTVAEFLANLRERPNALNYGSAGVASTSHLGMELLKSQAQAQITHVAYRGESPAIMDVVAGRISAILATLAVVNPLAEAGQVRVLGVTTASPTALAPKLPPLAEAVPGFEVTGWYGILAPKGTPDAIVAKLNEALVEALLDPATIAKLQALGVEPAPSSPAQFRSLIEAETTKWRDVIRRANISVD